MRDNHGQVCLQDTKTVIDVKQCEVCKQEYQTQPRPRSQQQYQYC